MQGRAGRGEEEPARREPGGLRADCYLELPVEDVEAVGVLPVEVRTRAVVRIEHRLEDDEIGEVAFDEVEPLVAERLAFPGA